MVKENMKRSEGILELKVKKRRLEIQKLAENPQKAQKSPEFGLLEKELGKNCGKIKENQTKKKNTEIETTPPGCWEKEVPGPENGFLRKEVKSILIGNPSPGRWEKEVPGLEDGNLDTAVKSYKMDTPLTPGRREKEVPGLEDGFLEPEVKRILNGNPTPMTPPGRWEKEVPDPEDGYLETAVKKF